MFSEYASRFLAQSQSRLSSFAGQTPDDTNDTTTTPARRVEWQSRGARQPGARSFLGRGFGGTTGNPYQPSGSRFGGFAARYSMAGQDAPLFHSARGGDINDDEEEERDREAADLYALRRSRQVYAASRLDESSEVDNENSRGSLGSSQGQDNSNIYGDGTRRLGIRSSWNGRQSTYGKARRGQEPTDDLEEDDEDEVRDTADVAESNYLGARMRNDSHGSSDGKGKMVDIGLNSTIAGSTPPADLVQESFADNDPPAFQKFRSPTETGPEPSHFNPRRHSVGDDSEMGLLRQTSNETAVGQATMFPDAEIFKHDSFFAWVFLISLASMFATFVLVWLHTSAPSGKKPWGDTIYTTLQGSFHLLAVDTLVAIIVSMIWLAALRSFVRYLVALILLAVPIVLFSFSLYPLVSSFQGPKGGSGLQDELMRYLALVPAVSGCVWVYLVWKGRSALKTAIEILEFSSRILAANSALVLVGMACLFLVVIWTWAWLVMFTRVFLGGYFSSSVSRFIISASSWWLGIYFVLMYIWTLSIITGVQRGTTAATVSQWYFHRNAQPAPSSREVVSAAIGHATTTIFGPISLSTLLALLVRLPLLVLPQRLAGLLGIFCYSFVPAPIAALTNPLTLTYAAIHSQNLATSARGLTQMDFLTPDAPTTTLTPRSFRFGKGGRRGGAPLLPYRLAKLLLHATRFVMAVALGFAGWVMTARQLRVTLPDGVGIRGSAYAYVVGLVASFIGWGVLGAMEGILGGIVDAVVICYGSESRMAPGGGGYCMEAAYLFGDRGSVPDRDIDRESVY